MGPDGGSAAAAGRLRGACAGAWAAGRLSTTPPGAVDAAAGRLRIVKASEQ